MTSCVHCVTLCEILSHASVAVFFSGYAGGGYAHSRGLLPDCVGKAGHGLPDSWSLLWKGNLPFSGIHEASEHLGHAASSEHFTEGLDHHQLKLEPQMGNKDRIWKNQSEDLSYQPGVIWKVQQAPLKMTFKLSCSHHPHLQGSVTSVTDLKSGHLLFVLLQMFCSLRLEVTTVMVYAWQSHELL